MKNLCTLDTSRADSNTNQRVSITSLASTRTSSSSTSTRPVQKKFDPLLYIGLGFLVLLLSVLTIVFCLLYFLIYRKRKHDNNQELFLSTKHIVVDSSSDMTKTSTTFNVEESTTNTSAPSAAYETIESNMSEGFDTSAPNYFTNHDGF